MSSTLRLLRKHLVELRPGVLRERAGGMRDRREADVGMEPSKRQHHRNGARVDTELQPEV